MFPPRALISPGRCFDAAASPFTTSVNVSQYLGCAPLHVPLRPPTLPLPHSCQMSLDLKRKSQGSPNVHVWSARRVSSAPLISPHCQKALFVKYTIDSCSSFIVSCYAVGLVVLAL
ncbi:hypothetical protein E2C01_001519 [Portunus trituberculatus]|uniref:Uncharacterized protein n=1 Tax=Portunus trituberculatus TaxID=210409 RepID=A0A5B7CGU3_PORTR|nr:hypothetical protein [Portunus trituberculatus]